PTGCRSHEQGGGAEGHNHIGAVCGRDNLCYPRRAHTGTPRGFDLEWFLRVYIRHGQDPHSMTTITQMVGELHRKGFCSPTMICGYEVQYLRHVGESLAQGDTRGE